MLAVTAALLAGVASASPAINNSIDVYIDWGTTVSRSATAATVEVDVMPFLGRTDYGGPFNAYYQALSNLGSEYVRYAPWFPNPRVVVNELRKGDCTASKPATNWNSTLFDEIMSDFMAAVCGPNAVKGDCKLSVVQQLSTMPSWMYVGGYCQDGADSCLPVNPWDTTDPFSAYAAGAALVDKSCGEMARYMGRLVGWYTAGGFHDECGHWHESNLQYNWYGLSVLNEDEHHIQPDNGVAYTTCFDAIKAEVSRVNPTIVLVGPEIINGHPLDYMYHFLNASNHADNTAPEIGSYHWGSSATGPTGTKFFSDWDQFVIDTVEPIDAFSRSLASQTELVINEFIPFVNDWCDCGGVEHLCGGERFPKVCPDWQDNKTAGGDPNLQHGRGVRINRRTVGWNAAAACFAYGFGTLAERSYKYVGQDQLIGGTWPDNEPAVSCMDWTTGQVNAKYWVTQLLAQTVGTKEDKAWAKVTIPFESQKDIYALPYTINNKGRGVLVINKTPAKQHVTIAGRYNPGTKYSEIADGVASCVEVNPEASEPGFEPPVVRQIAAGRLTLHGYAVCVVTSVGSADV